jgi:hypothetical protein
MKRRRKPLHVFQFVAGALMLPLAVWLYLKGDYLGMSLAIIAGVLALAYTIVNLFVRDWP